MFEFLKKSVIIFLKKKYEEMFGEGYRGINGAVKGFSNEFLE